MGREAEAGRLDFFGGGGENGKENMSFSDCV